MWTKIIKEKYKKYNIYLVNSKFLVLMVNVIIFYGWYLNFIIAESAQDRQLPEAERYRARYLESL